MCKWREQGVERTSESRSGKLLANSLPLWRQGLARPHLFVDLSVVVLSIGEIHFLFLVSGLREFDHLGDLCI